MKQKPFSNTSTLSSGIVLLSFTVLALALSSHGAEFTLTNASAVTLQQKPGDLLAGIAKAVCYSGFRNGQHPDRGAGAVNPSDAEILEYLQMVSWQAGFKLIRLYDAQVNSEAVLRLIETNKLEIKVLLGAWLDAEVSNPNCPWQKDPYPADVLARNKQKNAAEIERAIRLANKYSNSVVAVAVGNEALVDWNDHMVPVDSVIN